MESMGVRLKMRWPIVLTMRHPPNAVPAVRATPVTTFAHSGTDIVVVCPEASSRTAMTPIDFWRRCRRG